MERHKHLYVVAWAAACASLVSPVLADSISFQNGVNGYNGTVQIRITSGLAVGSTGGSIIDPDFAQLRKYVPGTTEGSWMFWRFDNMFGTGPNQIPPKSTILSARLELRTCSNVIIPGLSPSLPHGTGPRSVGPACVTKMFYHLDETLVTLTQQWGVCGNPPTAYCPILNVAPAPVPPLIWAQMGPEGPDFAGGDFDRPVGGFINMTVNDRVESAEVAPIVQDWANGADNHGFAVFMDTTDNWTVEGTGNDYHYPGDVTRRPRLIVDYTPTRTFPVVFQNGTNDYTGCSMLRVGQDNTTLLGDTIDVTTVQAYLDGSTGPTDPEFDALIKFDNAVGYGPGAIPPTRTIVKAYLALTTPPESNSTDVRSSGPFTAHRLLVDADWTGSSHPAKPFLWSEFANADGPTTADNEISAALASAVAMSYDGRAYFDVTSTVQAWQNGQPNYGFAIKPGTTDGWKIHWNHAGSAADVRPQLILLVAKLLAKPADFNGDTFVDEADLNIFLACATRSKVPFTGDCSKTDFDNDTDVDMDDFSMLQMCFNGTNPAIADCVE